MPYHVQPMREILVRPALPEQLSRMMDLAYNILWSWDHHIRALFRRLDPALWRATGHNPVLMLGRISQAALQRAAADPRFLALYRRACERLDNYLAQQPVSTELVAYFSMEYGLVDCMPIYSGGLGVLSGDHLKSSSDALIPLAGIGLLYQKGYLKQSLSQDGWQQERNPVNDFYTLPVRPCLDADGQEVIVPVDLPAGVCRIKVWHIDVGRVKLYLLDTNIAENERPEMRAITDQLYGGDIHTRIQQEIVLGIGGLRALKALGIHPTAYHMNEGHSAFLAVERIRVLMQEQGLSFDEALEASRMNNVFTTHTPVPAGIDVFDRGLLYEYFQEYANKAGISMEQLIGLGVRHLNDYAERFSMAVLAIKASAWRNAVSKLHEHVSQEMFQDLWPKLPTNEVPITSVTNGVHLPTFLNGDLALLYDQYLQPDWRERHTDPKVWEQVAEIPDQELWEAHRRRKRLLVNFVRDRVVATAQARQASTAEIRRLGDVLDPEAFTIGFARRFATYKRATLFLRNVERLHKILNNLERPVQIVIAGKAHPKDNPGKQFIREIVQLSRDPQFSKRLVFLEDYGIDVARELVQGVDLWLNNPRRGEEACGTSGMKAAINGVLNLSILDGWYDEAYEASGGWAIGDRSPYAEDQDQYHADAIYSLLEHEIVPMYYEDRGEGVPFEWMRRVKMSLRNISPWMNAQRMVEEYASRLYVPAQQGFAQMQSEQFGRARQLTSWGQRIAGRWNEVRFVDVNLDGVEGPVSSGRKLALRATLDLAGLSPEDVRVEAVVGSVNAAGVLEEPEVVTLPAQHEEGAAYTFAAEYLPPRTGRIGYSVRVSPNHNENAMTRPCSALLKWGND